MTEVNYFSCTLGQASLINQAQGQRYNDIDSFLHHQASTRPNLPALGFAYPSRGDRTAELSETFSFGELRKGAIFASTEIDKISPHDGSTIALLCSSTCSFVFTWLGMILSGHPALLLAPQLQPSAIAHLCKTCSVTWLLYDEQNKKLAEDAASTLKDGTDKKSGVWQNHVIPFTTKCIDFLDALKTPNDKQENEPATKQHQIAYIHHTSGTSSGLPKPIYQSHHAAIGVLPQHLEGSSKASFTTTPMYHGGPADCFRAWASNAMIWLFPGSGYPVTSNNISQCVQKATTQHGCPPVKYLSAVPFILQMMAEDQNGLSILQRMDVVGVGGAVLPEEAGNKMVKAGINLISRFGSAECGFLLSSHRDYEKDKDWQYFRNASPDEQLTFEKRDDSLAELVVRPSWPHRARTNRPDGSFATADLFECHPSVPNAWRYHSRADSQLTLITGKKFDPAPLESTLATHPLLSDVLIFGEGRHFPGALLFRSEASNDLNDSALVTELAPVIERINRDTQDHARLGRNMLKIMPRSENALAKSSKGTIMRGQANKAYKQEIDEAYEQAEECADEYTVDEEVTSVLQRRVSQILQKDGTINPSADLFDIGVDSVASIQLRHTVRRLLGQASHEPPLSIVEDCGSIDRLAEYIINERKGPHSDHEKQDDTDFMGKLVNRYGAFSQESCHYRTCHEKVAGEVVVLTGVTGALGAYILEKYRKDPLCSTIYCLVRGADDYAVFEKTRRSLEERGLSILTKEDEKVVVLRVSLSDERLGLSEDHYSRIANQATMIIHLAWAVNFRLRLRSFVKDHISGLKNLLDLALNAASPNPPRFAFCSSVASVSNWQQGDNVPELMSQNPLDATPLGYSRSKWVAEQICLQANNTTRLRGRLAILRVGQLSGDSATGHWNMKEAYPTILSSMLTTGCLPALEFEPLTWLPVDLAASAMIEATYSLDLPSNDIRIHHIVNGHRETDWLQAVGWLQEQESFSLVSPFRWLESLARLQDRQPEHPVLHLLNHFRMAYGAQDQTKGQGGKCFALSDQTLNAAPSMKLVKAVDLEYFGRLWMWIRQNTPQN